MFWLWVVFLPSRWACLPRRPERRGSASAHLRCRSREPLQAGSRLWLPVPHRYTPSCRAPRFLYRSITPRGWPPQAARCPAALLTLRHESSGVCGANGTAQPASSKKGAKKENPWGPKELGTLPRCNLWHKETYKHYKNAELLKHISTLSYRDSFSKQQQGNFRNQHWNTLLEAQWHCVGQKMTFPPPTLSYQNTTPCLLSHSAVMERPCVGCKAGMKPLKVSCGTGRWPADICKLCVSSQLVMEVFIWTGKSFEKNLIATDKTFTLLWFYSQHKQTLNSRFSLLWCKGLRLFFVVFFYFIIIISFFKEFTFNKSRET